MKLEIGQISYLNSEPFYPLLDVHRLVSIPPSELGRLAERGEIDAGIMATADYLRLADRYEPVADLGVANREEVKSILFYSRRPMNRLSGARLAVTEETSTSVRLLRLLLEVRDAVRPEAYIRWAPSPGEPWPMHRRIDAYLLIGNQALRSRSVDHTGFPYVYDLASEWWQWKRLPFVFALWVIRRSLPERDKRSFAELLERSFAKGMTQIDEIADRYQGELGSSETLASYLRNFHYRLGVEEKRGLEEFRSLVKRYSMLGPI